MKQLIQLCLLLGLLFAIPEVRGDKPDKETMERLKLLVTDFPNIAEACWPRFSKKPRTRHSRRAWRGKDWTAETDESKRKAAEILKAYLATYYPALTLICNETAWHKYEDAIQGLLG